MRSRPALLSGAHLAMLWRAGRHHRSADGRILSNAADLVLVGILPLGAAAFLVWLLIKSLLAAPAPQLWSVAGVAVSGVVLIFVARFVLRSPFFQIPRESAS